MTRGGEGREASHTQAGRASPLCHLLPLCPADALAVWLRACGTHPRAGKGVPWRQTMTLLPVPPDLGPPGAAVLHMDWVRWGPWFGGCLGLEASPRASPFQGRWVGFLPGDGSRALST